MATSSSIESIVPDSTMGTSPVAVVFSPVTTKRPVRTYGRKKSPALEEDAPMLGSFAFPRQESSSSSRLRTAPPSIRDTVGPSSDNEDEDFDDLQDTGMSTSKFRFDWKAKLKAMDDSDSDNEDNAVKAGTEGSARIRADRPLAVDDIFSSSSPGRGSVGDPEHLFLPDNDSEGENEFPKTSPTATTPEAGHSSTPGDQSTPATTDPDAPGSRSSKREGKQRSLEEVRLSILPVISPSPSPNARRNGSKRKSALKKPTKRDREETIKESARLASEREVSIKSNSKSLFTLDNLFQTVTAGQPPLTAPKKLTKEPSLQSDPIMNFSSPEFSSKTAVHIPEAGPSKWGEQAMQVTLESDDDDDLPDNLLGEPKAEHKPTLKEFKRRHLEKQKAKRSASEDDGSDLEITSPKAAPVRSTERRVSQLRKKQLSLAGVNPSSKLKATSLFKGKSKEQTMNRSDMDANLWGKVQKEQREVVTKKKEDWIVFGGRLDKEETRPQVDATQVLKAYAEKGLKAREGDKESSQTTLVEEDEDSDDEWKPAGSMSPAHRSGGVEEEEKDLAMTTEDLGEDAEDEEDEQVLRVSRSKRVAVVDSDEENDENSAPKPAQTAGRRPLALDSSVLEGDIEPDGSTPFSEEGTGTDKENNASLVFDRSEDKENSRVPRFGSLSSADSFESLAAPSGPQSRNPLQEIPRSPETPKTRPLGRTNLTQLFEAQMNEPRRTPELQPSPFPRQRKDSGGFSQFSQEDGTLLNNSSPGSGLADLFNVHTQAPSYSPKSSLLAEPFGEKFKPRGTPRAEFLSLTQDILQPAFHAEEQLLLKANKIVEKEQELVLDVAFEPEPSPPKLYVNEEGFLTQTRPPVASGSQLEGRRSLLATPLDPLASSSQRSPLATLSFSDPSQSSPVGPGPLRRLRKRSQSPSERAVEANTKKRRNVFDDLKQGAQAEAERKRRRLEKSEFVEQEAHESDDEGGFWGRGKKADDDEDMGDEDLDKTLEGLVDDQVMDDDTLAEQRVLEKFKEQAEQDDQRIEQKANDIVQGEWRKKHKDGGFMSDDSDDEMDDDARRARRRLRREKMKREDVEAMEANPETKAFAAAYKSTVEEEDNEFAHLAQDETERVLGSLDALAHEGEEDEDRGDEDDGMEEEEEKTIDAGDIRQLIRQRAQQPRERDEERIDFNDTTWVDQEDQDEDVDMNIKTVKPSVKKPARSRRGLDPSDMDDGFESQEPSFRVTTKQLEREKTWAKREERNRNGTTARNTGKMAVTAKSGKGSLHRGPKFKGETPAEPSKPVVRKAPSMLVDVDRKARFS
ncbi:hypothetical protein BKA70DRAFT_1557505 [Coprinopsis sp. MPI-PUGE-AT-0042]|nr:hypothetical protein BKA70DRAFT_1557505 [Coprinopsis sp. MPI-PUGE-AT-0042]